MIYWLQATPFSCNRVRPILIPKSWTAAEKKFWMPWITHQTTYHCISHERNTDFSTWMVRLVFFLKIYCINPFRLKFYWNLFSRVQFHNISKMVQIMAWHWGGNKPLSELIIINLLMQIYITWPQWVKGGLLKGVYYQGSPFLKIFTCRNFATLQSFNIEERR